MCRPYIGEDAFIFPRVNWATAFYSRRRFELELVACKSCRLMIRLLLPLPMRYSHGIILTAAIISTRSFSGVQL